MNMNLRNMTALPSLMLLAAVLAACGDDEASDNAATPTGPGDAAAAVAAEAPRSQDLAYTYNALDRRDPFTTYFDEVGPLIGEDLENNKTELQKVDIDKLKLVAVIVGTATPMAMVQDGAGRGHTVKIGTLIGKRLGQVKHIRRGEIIVQEEFRDFTGKRIPKLLELKLEDDEVKGP